MFAVHFLLLVLPLASAQVEVPGRCPNLHVKQDFNLQAYLGTWYEISRIPNNFDFGTCVNAEYRMAEGNAYVTGQHSQRLNGQWSTSTVDMRFSDSGEAAKLFIQFSKSKPYRPYWVLDTDYETYAIVYQCKNNFDTHLDYAWILSRTPFLDPQKIRVAKNFLLNSGINSNVMTDTDQSCGAQTQRKN